MKAKYTALPEQTIFDVALQKYGSADAVVWIIEDNPGIIDANGNFDLSNPIDIRDSVMNKNTVTQYGDYIPATGRESENDFALIDLNNDTPIDNNSDTPIANI